MEEKKQYKHVCNLCGYEWVDDNPNAICEVCMSDDVTTEEVK